MFKNDLYPKTGSGAIQRRFLFTAPYPTSKVRIDEIKGAEKIAMKIEFLGIASRVLNDPFQQGFQIKSKIKR